MSISTHDPAEIGRVLRDRLRAVFGDRLRGLVLYGSHARGEADEGSDFDFLVLLDRVDDFGDDRERISPLAADLSLQHDIVVSALPVADDTFAHSDFPLYRNARREGVVLT